LLRSEIMIEFIIYNFCCCCKINTDFNSEAKLRVIDSVWNFAYSHPVLLKGMVILNNVSTVQSCRITSVLLTKIRLLQA